MCTVVYKYIVRDHRKRMCTLSISTLYVTTGNVCAPLSISTLYVTTGNYVHRCLWLYQTKICVWKNIFAPRQHIKLRRKHLHVQNYISTASFHWLRKGTIYSIYTDILGQVLLNSSVWTWDGSSMHLFPNACFTRYLNLNACRYVSYRTGKLFWETATDSPVAQLSRSKPRKNRKRREGGKNQQDIIGRFFTHIRS